MRRRHTSWGPDSSLFAALLLLLLLLVPPPGADLSSARAEEADEDEGEVEPGPDLGDQNVPFPEQVNRAIELGVQFLRSRPEIFTIPGTEDLKGAWWGYIDGDKTYTGVDAPVYRHAAGPTALALYTLLKCGVSPKARVIDYGFNWIRSLHKVDGTHDSLDLGDKERYITYTVAGSSYELSAMILALTAKYDQYKKSARSRSARQQGKLKIKNKADKLWLQQLVTALVRRRGYPTSSQIAIDKSMMARLADPLKEESAPGPPEGELDPIEKRRGWRYNVPNLNLVEKQTRKSPRGGTSTNTIGAGWSLQRMPPGDPPVNQDLSSTQLAALALFAAQQFGAKFDPRVWVDIAEYTLLQQEDDGPKHERHVRALRAGNYAAPIDRARGFIYVKGASGHAHWSKASGSMTACGIANLLMAKESLHMTKEGEKLWEEARLDARVANAIWDGLAWLDRNWSAYQNPVVRTGNRYESAGYHTYYLYALEREQDLRGKELLGKHLWYREGAEQILARQKKKKTRDPTKRGASKKEGVYWDQGATLRPVDVLDTCFCLLFLKRATKAMVPTPITPDDSGPPADNR